MINGSTLYTAQRVYLGWYAKQIQMKILCRKFCSEAFMRQGFRPTPRPPEDASIGQYRMSDTGKALISPENQDRENAFEVTLFCNGSGAVEQSGTMQGNLWELPNKFVNNFCKLVFWQSIISWPEPPSSSERITDSIPSNHHHAWWMFHRRF